MEAEICFGHLNFDMLVVQTGENWMKISWSVIRFPAQLKHPLTGLLTDITGCNWSVQAERKHQEPQDSQD